MNIMALLAINCLGGFSSAASMVQVFKEADAETRLSCLYHRPLLHYLGKKRYRIPTAALIETSVSGTISKRGATSIKRAKGNF